MAPEPIARERLIATSIRYILALPTNASDTASPFQGLSFGLLNLAWALRGIVLLPANLVEAALPREAALARRVPGARSQRSSRGVGQAWQLGRLITLKSVVQVRSL